MKGYVGQSTRPGKASTPLLVLLLLCSTTGSPAALLSTPWATLEQTDKDRAISRQPWATYESSSVVGFNSIQPPVSTEAALDPLNYRVTSSAGDAISIVETSFRSRLVFLSLRATVNFPNPTAWGHHVFLRVSPALQSGSYNITALAAAFGEGTTVQLTVDEDTGLNENIRVNQVGYPLNGPKRAIVGSWLGSHTAQAPYIHTTLKLPNGDSSPFSVVNAATGAVAFLGKAQLFGDGAIHEYFKQVAWHLDFSALHTPGRYYIKMPGLGVSHSFLVSEDALRPALGAVSRTLYGQRCGVILQPEFLYPWERPEPCHANDAEVMAVDPQPPAWFAAKMPLPNQSNSTTLPPNPDTGSYFLPQAPGGTRLQVVGGHHDAGDYGKYVINSGSLVGWLMNSLEVLGAEHDDLPLPEAGDGIPDILQVVQHELKFLEGMQDKDGGVYCVVKPNTTNGEYYEHHVPCGTPGKDQCNLAPDSPVRGARIAWPKDTTCTAQFAAAMARAGRSPWMKTLRPQDADRYLSNAIKAWNFLTAKAPYGALCYHFYGCMGAISTAEASPPPWHNTYNCFDPQGDQSHDERVWAAVELYAATGDEKYHAYFLERHCPRFRRWGWGMLPFSYGLATVTYAQLAAQAKTGNTTLKVDAIMGARCLDELATAAKGYSTQAQASPYFLAVPERTFSIYGYGWQFQASIAAQMLMAAALAASDATEANLWRDMAAMQLHYIMGVNPQGYSLITGLGARRITNPVDDESVYDDLDAPWPGQIVGLASGFSWLNEYGSVVGKAFPPGNEYAVFNRMADAFNVNTEYTVPEMALALGTLAALSGPSRSALPSKPTLSVLQSVASGPAPLNVSFQLSVSGSIDDIATLEYDFGDGGHSYQASTQHTYLEPGRTFNGFATVVDRRGQTATQKFTITTSFAANAFIQLDPPPGLQLVAKIGDAAGSSSSPLPSLLVVSEQLTPGGNASLSVSVAADAVAGMAASSDNLAYQGPRDTWTGVALHPVRFEDRAAYAIEAVSTQATQAILTSASGGLALDAWLFVNKFLTYSRDNVPLLAVVGLGGTFFGLQGSKWTGNQMVAGNVGVVANETHLKPAFTPGRWHYLRLAAVTSMNGSGVCGVWVDGKLIVQRECSPSKVFNFCATTNQALKLVVGTFDGYVAGVRVFASPHGNLTNICGARPPPPAPSPSPAPPPPANLFSPYIVNAATIAVMDADSSCGLSGAAVNASLPLRLYSYGKATGGALLPYAASYTDGLSVSDNNPSWSMAANASSGCSLRVASEAVPGGNAALQWRLPQSLLQPALYTNAFTVEAKVYVEVWRKGYSQWNSDVLGTACNWDTFFKFSHDIWKGPSLLLSTPSASTTGAFAGTLVNTSVVEATIVPGTWHHVVLAANSTTCVLSVDGVEVAAGKCEAKTLLWGTNVVLSVGGFVGWVDDLAVSADARRTQAPNTTDYTIAAPPPLPPPPASPSPSPAPMDNRFSPVVINAATIAVMDADSSCGLSGAAVNASLPLRLYSYGKATGGALLPYAASYTDGLSVSGNNPSWSMAANASSGCSLRVASEAVPGGNAALQWRLPQSLLQPALYTNAFTVEAKVYVEVWRKGYSQWNSDVLGTACNWDTFFKFSHDIWKGPSLLLSTPSASTTGAFAGTLVNTSVVEATIVPGIWHHVALAANSTTCVLSVDGVEVAVGKCEAKTLLWGTNVVLSVGGFVGWVDDLAVSADARRTQVPNTVNYTLPPPPPLPQPSPSPSPAPAKPDNRFAPLTIDAATIAVMDADSACGMSGSVVGSSLPLVLYGAGKATGVVLLPSASSYTAGLSVAANSSIPWAKVPSGCSLRLSSEAVSGGNALVSWKMPQSVVQPAITANAFTVEAKVYVEIWRKGYSKWNSDVLGTACNWDTFFKFSHDIWKGPSLLLSTPSTSTTGAFAGTLVNTSVVEATIVPGIWHHVALAANSTTCVLSVDGVEVAAGKCEAKKLLWQTNVVLSVGGFVGWVDDLAVSAAARPTQVPQRP